MSNKHALLNAKKIRKIQEIHKEKTFKKLVNTHLHLLFEHLRSNKGNQFYFYTVQHFIAGFPILNEEQVDKITNEIIQRVKKANKSLKIKKLKHNLILITWEIHERNEETTYINELVNSISIQIKECITQSENHLKFVLPDNFRFPKECIATKVKKILVQNGYKVFDGGLHDILYINW